MNDNSIVSSQPALGKSRRIASNTIVLFVRMFLLTIINLYAVRLVLNGLGEVDYGIFNTVAGVITTSMCVSSVLELSMQRFYATAMGEHDFTKLQNIFSASIVIILVLAVIIILLFETIGLWFLNTQLVIPVERMATTQWIYQFALFAFVCSILQIPFTSAIFAHEEMGIYALITTIDCLLRLTVAIVINHIEADHLYYYSLGLLFVATITFITYAFIGKYRYEECKFRTAKKSLPYKGILLFSGWALYGSLANVGLLQGSTILLNVFFGPLIIASFAISLQIYNAFNTLCNSMVLAFRPAMIKAFAEKNFHFLNQLFAISNKLILYGLTIVAFPIFTEMETILKLWLGDISDYMVLFARLIIIYAICLSLNNPISIIMHATGRIKEYNLPVESITLLCVPITWMFFSAGNPPQYVFISMIGVCLLAHIVRLFALQHYYQDFSIKNYILLFIRPSVLFLSLYIGATYVIYGCITDNIWRFLVVFFAIPLLGLFLAYATGINKEERIMVRNVIKSPKITKSWIR